jgi:hypothetical protein
VGKIFQSLKKKVFVLFLFLLLVSSVSALQTFAQNEDARLCHAVRKDDAIPTATTLCNITISHSFNGSTLVDFQAMDDLNDRFCLNLTINHTAIRGLYDYEVTCADGVDNETLDSQYLVNLGGIEPSEQRTDTLSRTIYIFFCLALITFLSLFWIKKTPFKLSLFLIMVWFLLMGINTSYIAMQDEVVNTNIENFFSFFLVVSFWANYAIFISIAVIWAITFIVTMYEKHQRSLVKEYG